LLITACAHAEVSVAPTRAMERGTNSEPEPATDDSIKASEVDLAFSHRAYTCGPHGPISMWFKQRLILTSAVLGLVLAALPSTALAGHPSVFVAITSPASGSTVFGSITISGTASAKFGVSSVSVAVDSGSFQPAGGTSSWTYQLNTDNLTNAIHTITARAADTHGQTATTSISVTVNNAPPTISIASPTPGSVVSGRVFVSGASASQAGVVSVQVRVDTGPWQPASGTTNWSAAVDTATFADGSHTVFAMAADSVGHTTTISISVTFSNSPPAISISTPQAGATVAGSMSVSGSAASLAGIASVQVQVDANGWVTAAGTTTWNLAVDTTAYANGPHTLSAMASDSLGRSSTTSVSVTVSNLIKTYESPWYVKDGKGNVSTVNATMNWDGNTNFNSKLPSGNVRFQVNSTVQPNDANVSDTCSQDPVTGFWSCVHQIQSADLYWNSVIGWSLHYAFQLQVEYPPTSTFTISYGGDSNFAPSSAQAVNT